MVYARGSEWRKWDLHVHTPCSLIHHYGGDGEEVWAKFLADLEALPQEFSVIGINDYLFIDGYKRVLAAKRSGRLSNIDLILPVIELRLDKFGGSESSLSRVNFHVIFSDELDPEVIEHQFLNALSSSYQLSPKYADKGISWKGVPNRAGLLDLGEKIIASVPPKQRKNYGPPLKEGFFNLNLNLSKIQEILAGPYFKDKVIFAVGNTEWGDIKWNDQSVADKKMIINSADLVFTSASSPDACIAVRTHLTKSGVNDRLLDCSDAHRFSTSTDKDRIGKCFTWIKADPTFIGLRHAIHEAADRTFVGDTPPQLLAVRSAPTKFIDSLKMNKATGSALDEIWFDHTDIPFGTGLIAIIGNKGSGKSALADILSLLSDSPSMPTLLF